MGRVERNLCAIALIGLTAVVLTPLVLYPNPALLDYQNHLARLWVIADPQHQAQVARYYSVDWAHVSNDIINDLAARFLGGLASAQTIGRLCLAASIVLPPVGAIALNARLFGRPGVQALIIPFFAWTTTALAGFMNFQIGVGLALLSIAIEPIFGRRWPTLLLGRTACGVLIYLAHGLDLIFYAILLAAMTFTPADSPKPLPTLGARIARALSAAGITIISAAIVVAATGVLPGNQEHAFPTPGYRWHHPIRAVAAIAGPLRGYDLRVDAILALMAAGALALAAFAGRISIDRRLMWTTAVFVVLSPFMPYITPSGGWTDQRLPLLALFTALAAFRIEFPRRSDAALFAATAALLVSARTGYIAYNWAGAERLSEAVDQALAAAPSGAAVLSMQHEPARREIAARPAGRFLAGKTPTYWFLGTSVVWLKGGFSPMLFAQRGVHPLRVNPPWDAMAYKEGGKLPSIAAFSDGRLMAKYPPYVSQWRRFDYVLVMNADYPDCNGAAPLPPELTLVKDAGFAQLFRVTQPSGASGALRAPRPVG